MQLGLPWSAGFISHFLLGSGIKEHAGLCVRARACVHLWVCDLTPVGLKTRGCQDSQGITRKGKITFLISDSDYCLFL